MAENFIIKDSPGKGRGLFSTTDIEKNQIIFKFKGINLLKKDIPDFSGPVASCHIQIGSELYLDLRGDPSYFINHSCTPNVCIKVSINTAFAMALIPIKAGEELFFDYSTTSTETPDTWSLECGCSIYGCRKLITGFNSVPMDKQKEYLAAGMIPKYVQDFYKK